MHQAAQLRSRRLAGVLAAAVAAVTGGFFALWLLGEGEVVRWLGASMKANTAFSQLLLGISILIALGKRSRARSAAARTLALIALAIGASTLFAYAFGFHLPIDELFARDHLSVESVAFPGRMAPNAAFAISLLAGATALLGVRTRSAARIRSTLALAAAVVAMVALIGYTFGQTSLYQIASFIRITPYTATTVLLLAWAIVLARPESGPGALLASPYSEGQVARRLLPFATLSPIAFTWIVMSLRQIEAIDRPTGYSLLAISMVIAFCAALGWVSSALARSDAHLRMIREGLPHFVAYLDRSRRYLYLNQAYAEWFGGHPEDFVGRTVPEVVGDEVFSLASPRVARAFEGEVVRFDIDLEREGESKALDMTYIPDRDPYGQVSGILLLGHDITERKRAERARDLFLSVASHELKTPVTVMKLQNQLRSRTIARGDGAALDLERTRKMHETDERQLDRLTRLIEDMLDISRISSGRLDIRRERCDLGAIVSETVARFRPQFEAIDAPLALEAEPVTGEWDPYRIEQVVSNLLTNAAKYGSRKPVAVRVRAEGDEAVLEVEDSGRGIAPENRERIFQRFERVTPDDAATGLGLGLYISREIVDRHGGRIELRSELGQGSAFIVRLPRA